MTDAHIPKETKEKIAKLQILEQNMQGLLLQKQQFQSQLFEIESALKEVEKTQRAYKIIGGIMASVDKEELKKELGQKKELLEIRLNGIQKQEKQLGEKAKALQEEVISSLKTK
ncbi:MAG: prefoldin subunit beta [Candidatus Woesearchaeota archaeon]